MPGDLSGRRGSWRVRENKGDLCGAGGRLRIGGQSESAREPYRELRLTLLPSGA
jgi:hypothetical protein